MRSFFSFFLSYLVLSASDRRPLLPYSYTYTQRQMHISNVISSLPSVVLTHAIKNGSLSHECLLYESERHFFFSRLFVLYVFMWQDVSASRRNFLVNYLLARPCVMYKHVLCSCTTVIPLCRAVAELWSTIWQAYTKPCAVYCSYGPAREPHKTIPLLNPPWPPSLRDAVS